jgi:hypothetical protein
MSFRIAKIIDGQIFIHVDSLLTGEHVIRHQSVASLNTSQKAHENCESPT